MPKNPEWNSNFIVGIGSKLWYYVFIARFMDERGKSGGHEPPLFPLPCHILAFLSSGSHEPPLFPLPYHHIWLFRAKLLFWMVYLGPLKCDFWKSSRVTQKSTTQTIFSILLKIDILWVEFLNCFTRKFLTNLIEYCILKYHKV